VFLKIMIPLLRPLF